MFHLNYGKNSMLPVTSLLRLSPDSLESGQIRANTNLRSSRQQRFGFFQECFGVC